MLTTIIYFPVCTRLNRDSFDKIDPGISSHQFSIAPRNSANQAVTRTLGTALPRLTWVAVHCPRPPARGCRMALRTDSRPGVQI